MSLGVCWRKTAGGLNCGGSAASEWKLGGMEGDQEQEGEDRGRDAVSG